MKLRHPGLIGLVALLASWLIRVWLGTVRFKIAYLGDRNHPKDPRREPTIYIFWHEVLLFPTVFKTRIHTLISQHADGELIARVCKHLGFGVVRGSTTRGGGPALMEMAALRNSHLAITPDGPRGPRRRVQLGVIYLASLTGLPLVAVGGDCDRAWRVRSWDRMLLPKPWCTAHSVAGRPIYIPKGLDRDGLEYYRELVESELNLMMDAAANWARGGPRPTPAILDTPKAESASAPSPERLISLPLEGEAEG